MKIKMLIPMALVLCLAFSLCACGTTVTTNETTTAPATTVAETEAATTASEETTTAAAATTAADTNAETEAEAEFTEEDALKLVEDSYSFSEEYFFMSNGTVDIDGTSYYAVDLRKSLDDHTTYISSYFVTLDGSEIHEGYIAGDDAVISDTEATLNITEENAVKAIEAAFDFEEGCFLTYRGVEEIDGVSYHAVDLRKSLESNVTYLSSFFITADGNIVAGYYENEVPVLAE